MSGELTTFKKNFNNWKADHPTRSPERWVATTDRSEAARFISKQAGQIRETQLQAADDIIASQERTRKELKAEISSGVDEIVDGLEGMKSTFEWGFSELVWQIEKQRETLESILETLRKPLDTQAKELRARAERAYENGWFDDALQDFLESEKKNRYDFTVHQHLGNIYFFHKARPDKAIEYYKKAAKYAEPKSAYHASFALLHLALLYYLKEDFSEAYEKTKKAVELSPLLYEARYQHSRYCARLGKKQEAVKDLKRAIANDINYALKANSEEDYKGMREQVTSLIERLTEEARIVAKERMKSAEKLIKTTRQEDITVDASVKKEIERKTDKIKGLQKGGLYDCQKAVNTAHQVYETAKEGLIVALEKKVDSLEKEKGNVHVIPPPGDTLLGALALLSVPGVIFFVLAVIISIVDDYYPISFTLVVSILAVLCGLILWASSRVNRKKEEEKKDCDQRIERVSGQLKSLKHKSPEKIEVDEKGRVEFVRQSEDAHENFVARVDIKLIDGKGAGGIQFRSKDNYDTYLYRIGGGYYQLDLVQGAEEKEEPHLTTLVKDFSPAIRRGDSWNQLKVKAVGPNIELYANGIHLDTVSDKTLQKGGLDVVGSTSTTRHANVFYDNFQVNSVQDGKNI